MSAIRSIIAFSEKGETPLQLNNEGSTVEASHEETLEAEPVRKRLRDRSYKVSDFSGSNLFYMGDIQSMGQRGHQKRTRYDRFIPDCEAMKKYSSAANLHIDKQAVTPYARSLLEALNLHPDYPKILLFSSDPKPVIQPKRFQRELVVPKTCDRMLEMLEYQDDFYLNPLSTTRKGDAKVAVSMSDVLYVYDYAKKQIMLSLKSPQNIKTAVAWRPSNVHILHADSHPRLSQFDLSTQTSSSYEVPIGTELIDSIDWKDETQFAVGNNSGEVHLYDARRAGITSTVSVDPGVQICGLKWSCDGHFFATGSNSKNVKVYDPRRTEIPVCEWSHVGAIKALGWPRNGHDTLLSGGGRGDTQIQWRKLDQNTVLKTERTGSQICQLEWLDDNYFVTTHGYNALNGRNIVLWKLTPEGCDFKQSEILEGQAGRILNLGVMETPSGFTLTTASSAETLGFWNLHWKDGAKKRARNENSTAFSQHSIIR